MGTNTFDTYVEHRKFLEKHISRIIHDGLKKLQAIEGMNKLIIVGYTPSFNDGDACEHWSTPYYGDDMYELASEHWEFLGLQEGLDYDDYEEYLDEHPINIITEENAEEIATIIGHLEDLFEEHLGTNFKIFIDLTGDEPTYEDEDYYCGY